MTDLASSPVFAGWTIHLVDLSAEAAETMARLGRRIAQERGAMDRFSVQESAA
jgi:alpha-galactosidase